ncbi:meiotically up-regulated protein [Physcia stellaris]|nr:meiotically up-regulated protein [Physcia stellaris]
MEDKDLARIFENAFPNTLDTTIRWHVDGSGKKRKYTSSWGQWDGAQSFVVTGDINAEWLRDSTNQLLQYQGLAKKEKKLENLILGAINTQAEDTQPRRRGKSLANGTGLIRSSFRPSDDATILQFLIPANAQISVELKRTSEIVKAAGKKALAARLLERAQSINKGVWEHGVVNHKEIWEVFAFEVDGYGSAIIMDDANIPSLLALPLLGFCDVDDKVYQNTRKMILDKGGNPYYLTGRAFAGVGGPHIGLQYAWPMSRLVEAMTSNDDDEIMDALHAVKGASQLGPCS